MNTSLWECCLLSLECSSRVPNAARFLIWFRQNHQLTTGQKVEYSRLLFGRPLLKSAEQKVFELAKDCVYPDHPKYCDRVARRPRAAKLSQHKRQNVITWTHYKTTTNKIILSKEITCVHTKRSRGESIQHAEKLRTSSKTAREALRESSVRGSSANNELFHIP